MPMPLTAGAARTAECKNFDLRLYAVYYTLYSYER